jgi:uncharacterized repeat protein (TIGR01451 family)
MSNLSRWNWLKVLSRSTPARGRQRSDCRGHRPALERLEDRTLPSVTIASTNNNGNGFAALDFNHSGGYVPPDTDGAAGPTNYVETVNQTVAIYSPKSTGASSTLSSLSNFWFTVGGLGHADSGSGLSDPVVTYNDQIGRFIVADQDVDFNTHVSRFDIAVSKTSSPGTLTTSDWTFYQVNTTESGFDADYPGNFGYNHDATVFTLNMFGVSGGGHCQVISLSNADLAANVTQSGLHLFQNDLNDFSDRPTVMHDSVAGDPMWLLTEHGDNTSIDVIKMTNVLSSSPTFAYTNLAVTPYSPADNPKNPNGTVITNNMDSRILKAAEWNNTIVAAHTVSPSTTEDDVQWYAINVSGATPVLSQQGRISNGNNTYSFFPSIDINSSGQFGVTYMRSGTDTSTDFMSMYVTGRAPSDPSGTMEASVLVPAGTGQANYKDFTAGGRAGDLSGINVDPSNGSFWAANEFANTEGTANWGTAVANFTISTSASADMAVSVSGPSSVTAGTNATYVITLTNNGPNASQGVVLSDLLPAGSSFVSITPTSSNPDSFTFSQSGSTIKETANASIASGNTDTFTLVVSAPSGLASGAAFNDNASVSATTADPNPANNSSTLNGTIATSADMAATLSGPATITAGTSATYIITINNNGPSNAQGVVVSDLLPAGSVFVSITPSGTNADSFTFGQSGGTITETATGAVTPGHNDSFTLVVSAPSSLASGAAFNDTASVSTTTTDPNSANNTQTVNGTINTQADLAVSNSGPASVTAGTSATYTITLTNNGPSNSQGVVLSDMLPTGAVFVSITAGAGNPDGFTFGQSGGTITETANTAVAAGHTDTFTLVVSAPSGLASGAGFSDTASVSSTTTDPVSNNNSSTVTGSITTSADVAVSATGPSSVTAGTSATYTITLSNAGPSDAQGVVLSDLLPAGANFVSITPGSSNPDGFTFGQSGNTITETATSAVTAGHTDSFTVVVSAPSGLASGAAFSDTASVSASTADPNSTNNSSTAAGTVATSADLAVTASGPSSVTPGTNATYTITLTNNGPSDAQGVVLSDLLPTGSTFVSMTPGAGNPDAFTFGQTGGTVTETANASVAAGHSDTFTVVVFAPTTLSAGAAFSDTASVSASTADPNTANNSATVAGTVGTSPGADLAVVASGPSSVTAGTSATYTITLTNNGPSSAQNVVLTDMLPAGSTLVSVTPGSVNPDTFSFGQSAGSISETTAAIATGNTDTFTVVVSAPSNLSSGAAFNDTASVSSSTADPNTANNTSTVTGAVATSADLAVTASGPASVTAGTSATYTVTLTNSGPSDAQGVVLSDLLPAGATFVSITAGSSNPDSFTFGQSGGTITETATASVAAGHSDSFTIVVSAPSGLANGATFSDTASASASTADPNTANNSSTAAGTVATSADLAVTASGPSSVTAGTSATYTVSFTNNGPSNAQGVVLSDLLPAGAAFVSITAATSNPDSFTFGQSGGTITETATAAVAVGNTDSFTVVVSAPSSLASGAAFNDTASVSASTADPNTANNSSTVTGTVATSADLAVTASGPSSVTAGTNATYSVTLSNSGPSDALGVVLSDLLPAGSSFVSITPSSGNPDSFTFAQSGGTITETANAAVASGHSDSFTIVVSAPSGLVGGAAFNDTASVSATTADPNSGNNSATVTGSIATNADLSVNVSGPSTMSEGASATYTITVTNTGPSDASAVSLTDTLGSLLNFNSATTSQGTFSQSAGVVTFSLGTVAANGTVTATVTAQALEDGSTSNVAAVSSTTSDPNPANNSASVTSSITEPAINVSGAISTRSRTLTNFQVATFTHASGVEPVSDFSATINWGDGTTSAGTISLSGSTYVVRGSHTYSTTQRHTIRTTVKEVGQAVNKVGDEHPGDDVVQFHAHKHHGGSADTNGASGPASGAAVSGSSVTFVSITSPRPSQITPVVDTRALDHFFELGSRVVGQLLVSHRHARFLSDWFVDSAS